MQHRNDTITANPSRSLDLSGIDEVLRGDFFKGIASTPLSPAAWQYFVKQKYGSVGSFLDFLRRGAALSVSYSPEIAEVFEDNYKDEIGWFAGAIRKEYAHEEWRLRSLKEFNITADDLKSVSLTPELVAYQAIVTSLVKSSDFFELVGALLFWEPFVVQEMTALIVAFERDLPTLFPPKGYDYTNFPHNSQEYWYSHAQHDVWHFKQIRESLQTYLDTHEITQAQWESLQRGMNKVRDAKALLYSKSLLERMQAM